MNKRMENFLSLEKHPMLGRRFRKLSPDQVNECKAFIVCNNSLNNDDFEKAVNRMFLDVAKPRNYKDMLELLSCSNSMSS